MTKPETTYQVTYKAGPNGIRLGRTDFVRKDLFLMEAIGRYGEANVEDGGDEVRIRFALKDIQNPYGLLPLVTPPVVSGSLGASVLTV